MRKFVLLLITLSYATVAVSAAWAADLPKPVEKFAKGACDVMKSPLSIYDHSKSEYDASEAKPFGLVKGIVQSPFYMLKRAGSGLMDMATFPIE